MISIPRTEVTLNSFGMSTAPGIGPSAAERRAKAENEALQARRDALPASVKVWAECLSFAEQEALAAVQRFYVANGSTPVAIPRADLAAHLNTSPEEAEALLNKLAVAGAVTRNLRFHSAPRYVPVAAPSPGTRALKTDNGKPADPSALGRLRSTLGVRPR